VRDALLGRDSKDADFLVPATDIAGLTAALEPHGRTEELVVADRAVGVRFYPRDTAVRRLARSGIELAPPRREVSTGPGRHDFAIVVDPTASVEDDLYRRDFTINAMARRLDDGHLVDPYGGQRDLEARILRPVSPTSFAEDPLRIIRGLRFISQLGLDPAPETLDQMRSEASSIKLVSGERIGGGIAADGMGELSKLLLGAQPAKALAIARDTGVLAQLLPELKAAIGFDQESRHHSMTVDEHTFAVVQAAADAHHSLGVRLAALFHDAGKPQVAWRGTDNRLHYYAKPGYSAKSHEQVSAALAEGALNRLRYPTELTRRVVRIVRSHMIDTSRAEPLRARRLLARYGDALLSDLLDHKGADLRGKGERPRDEDLAKLARLRKVVIEQQREPHRIRDLAVNGNDLIEIGYRPGPTIGHALRKLLDEVVRSPTLNTKEQLLERAKKLPR
jgi:tRNA nucleotidyltransferase (CCA-adding enzyme)